MTFATPISVSGSVNVANPLTLTAYTLGISAGTFNLSQALNLSNGTVNLSGGTLQAPNVNNRASFNFSGGTISSNFDNFGTLTVTGGGGTIHGALTNETSGYIKVTGPAVLTYTSFTNNGAYVSDPADNYFSRVGVGPAGYFQGGYGDRFFITGDFLSDSAEAAKWNTRHAELLLSGAGDHALSVDGANRGPGEAGYIDSFAWGTLSLAAGERLTLIDGNATPGGALYVGALLLADGAAQLADIQSNGLDIYYDPGLASNAYLGGHA